MEKSPEKIRMLVWSVDMTCLAETIARFTIGSIGKYPRGLNNALPKTKGEHVKESIYESFDMKLLDDIYA